MYTSVIIILLIGVALFIAHLFLCFKDHLIMVNENRRKSYLVPNVLGIISSILLILLGMLYFIMINSQL